MMGKLDVRMVEDGDLDDLVAAHRNFMSGYYTARLGRAYLRRYFWPTILTAPSAVTFLARWDGAVVGLIVCTLDTRRLRSAMLVGGGLLGNLILLAKSLSDRLVFRSSAQNIVNLFKSEPQGLPAAELFLIAVDSQRRGGGIGRRLMEAMDGWLAERGVGEVFLRVRQNNPAAIRLYRNMGYAEFATVAEMGDQWLLMMRSGGHGD